MDEEVKTARQIAAELMRQADWNIEKALTLALQESRDRPDIAHEVLRAGWLTFFQNVGSAQREALRRKAAVTVDSAARIQRVMQESFLDTWLVLNMPLRAATADDLRRSIASRKANAETEGKRAAFETAILKKLKPGKSVGDCWNETDIEQLARKML